MSLPLAVGLRYSALLGGEVRPLLIVKTGATLPELACRLGDFEDWISETLGPGSAPIRVCRVDEEGALPPPDAVAGVVVTGSPAMVSHRHPWSEQTAFWLRLVVERGVPVLGICFGHQLLAHALGAPVGPNPKGREMGTVLFRPTEAARLDPLLSSLPVEAGVQATHLEAVLEPPIDAVVLGVTRRDPCHAFRVVDRPAWGLQFHPEMTAEMLRAYVTARSQTLVAEGWDPATILESIEETPWGRRIMRRFRDLVDQTAAERVEAMSVSATFPESVQSAAYS